MAFVLSKKRIVTWPVVLNVPIDGGETQEHECTAQFEIIDQKQYNELMSNDIEFCMRVVVGFGEDIQDENGNPLPCNDETKRTLFESAGFVRVGFLNAYHSASSGITTKNSKGPHDIGRAARKSHKKK